MSYSVDWISIDGLTPWVAASRRLVEAPGAAGVEVTRVAEGAVATKLATKLATKVAITMEGTEGEEEDSLQHSIVEVVVAGEVVAIAEVAEVGETVVVAEEIAVVVAVAIENIKYFVIVQIPNNGD